MHSVPNRTARAPTARSSWRLVDPHCVQINYRTHSGIIDVASSIVDLIKHYFPRQIDNLERECAFFKGPPPLLLSSLDLDDISILLSGSNRNTSQVRTLPPFALPGFAWLNLLVSTRSNSEHTRSSWCVTPPASSASQPSCRRAEPSS